MSKKLPTVAIIGQANVGKSSLFNRIVRSKEAIVAREAGTTRDSVVRKVEYKKHSFWLADTAGLKDPNDEFESSIQEQIGEAADAADVILVVIDSTKYISDEDRLVAKKALKSRKPVILVTNKTDLKNSLPSVEFQRLGVKEVVRTSAEHGEGINKVLELITEKIPPLKSVKEDNILRLALIGRPNAGKSQLFNSLAGKQQAIVASRAGTTRDVNRADIRYQKRAVEILDTAGVRRSGKIEVGIEKFSVLRTLQAIEESDICLLLMDVNELNTQLDQKLAGMIKESGKGLVIVVSKWDSVKDKDAYTRDVLAPQIASEFNFVPWAPLIFTSAVTGQNVAKIFELALQIYETRQQELKTSDLNKLLQTATLKHPPAGLKNTLPKLRYIVQTDTNPPWFVVYGSNLKFLHWSYKRYLERNLREKYDFSGTPIMFSFRDEKQMKKRAARPQPPKL